MKSFQEYLEYMIQEGVNDPGIFKAFFTAGGQDRVNHTSLVELVQVKSVPMDSRLSTQIISMKNY